MLLAYFPFIVFESFANMMIETLRAMPTATMLRPKNAEPTIILMEESRQYGAAPVLVFTSAAATRGTVANRSQPFRPGSPQRQFSGSAAGRLLRACFIGRVVCSQR